MDRGVLQGWQKGLGRFFERLWGDGLDLGVRRHTWKTNSFCVDFGSGTTQRIGQVCGDVWILRVQRQLGPDNFNPLETVQFVCVVVHLSLMFVVVLSC